MSVGPPVRSPVASAVSSSVAPFGASTLQFSAPLLSSISGGKNEYKTAQRNSDATILDDNGYLAEVDNSHEMRFWGARRTRNLVNLPFHSWTQANLQSVTYGVDDPFGGTSAVNILGDTGSTSPTFSISITNTTAREIRNSIWLRYNSGTPIVSGITVYTGNGGLATNVFPKLLARQGEWVRVAAGLGVNTGANINVGFVALTTQALDIDVAFPQCEDVTNQQDKTPGPEVWPFYGNAGPNWATDFTKADQTWEGTEITPNGDTLTVNTLGTPRYWTDQEPIKVGHMYEVTCELSGFSGTGLWFLVGNTAGSVMSANGRYSVVVRATANSKIGMSGISGSATISNIRIAELDHGSGTNFTKYSTSSNGLEVIDTEVVTRTNAGVELVSDPDFSQTSNASDPWLGSLATFDDANNTYANAGAATATVQASGDGAVYQANRTYLVTVTIDFIATGVVIFNCAGQSIELPRIAGTHQIYFTPTVVSTAPGFLLSQGQSGGNLVVSHCSMRELGAPLSLNQTLGYLPDEGFTNIHTNSSDITAYANTGMTNQNDQTEGMYGGTTGAEIRELSGTTQHYCASPNWTTTASQYYTFSVHIKQSNRRFIELVFADSTGTNGVYAIFDLVTAEIWTGATAFGTGAVALHASILVMKNGYVRCAVTGQHSGTTSKTYIGHCDNTPVHFESFSGNTGIFTYVDAMQLINGVYPGSHVPTAGASANMVADQLQYNSPITSGPVSIFAEFSCICKRSDFGGIVSINDGTSANLCELYTNNNGFGAHIVLATVFQGAVNDPSVFDPNVTFKVGMKHDTSLIALYRDGVERGTRNTSAGLASGLSGIDIGHRVGVANTQPGSPMRFIEVHNEAFSDSKMEAKTR